MGTIVDGLSELSSSIATDIARLSSLYTKQAFLSQIVKPVPVPLQKVLMIQELSEYQISQMKMIELSICIRGSNVATDVLLFSPSDFHEKRLVFEKSTKVDAYGTSADTQLNGNELLHRPRLNNVTTGWLRRTPILTRGFWGWYAKEDQNSLGEVWSYTPQAETTNEKYSNISFYFKRADGKIAWSYFPISPNNAMSLERALCE